ncbi:GNAT family N-acetyltransferase [Bacillus sp. OK048]|uniref:GNAT family N-acetyltransferase n=1 Tax=Bacillus sp. OK048 TaxID=1882761 RepID=UPI0008849A43|nr:GNAT family N-acetyltransferase [Bacillus sp. OK048]SDN15554.1 Acetyltransferase (GNAT) domain-containing protein [Bacillus sp. OK048]
MEKYTFVKGYRENEPLRDSFNQLATKTFGIDFEIWYRNGFWTDKYQPYSFTDNGKIVANVSVNILNLVINNEEKQAVQIGTVMTHPDYRNQGLAKQLMDKVLKDYSNVDLIYLFANDSVLDFYPKFGFESVEEIQFSMDYGHVPSNQVRVRKLDGRKPDDLAFINNLAARRHPISRIFGTTSTEELLMFYCVMVFSQDLYYLEEEQALVIYQIDENVLHLYDLVSMEKVKVLDILSKISNENINQIVFHFTPDENELELEKQSYHSDTVLFVKNITRAVLPLEFKHPITSQA